MEVQLPGKIYIGTSGYVYDHWKGVFYPEGLPQKDWLEYYSRFFDIVELNVTFYNLPAKTVFEKWHENVGRNFKFVVKGPRLVTHYKKLKEIGPIIDIFYDRILPLKEKLEVVLWQFPPAWKINIERFESFVEILKKFPIARHAFEFRDRTWFVPEVYKSLSKINAAIVLCDWPFNTVGENQAEYLEINEKETIKVPDTANFFYIRRHGVAALYTSKYSKGEIQKDQHSIKKWSEAGNDVYEFFNNDFEGNAVENAKELRLIV